MVYCGKPSKGCSNCRERKIRCDQREPGCGQCEKRQQQCPGYRNMVDLMFRDESSHVIKKARARARKKGVLPSETVPSSVGSPVDTPRVSPVSDTHEHPSKSLSLLIPASTSAESPGLNWSKDDILLPSPVSGNWPATPGFARMYNLAPSLQERGMAYFFSRYVSAEENVCHHRFDFVYDIWQPSNLLPQGEVDGALASMTAVGLVGLATLTRSNEVLDAARKSYCTALRLTNNALRSPVDVLKDTTMLSVLILGAFEMMMATDTHTMTAWHEHVDGAVSLAKLRGVNQFQTKAGIKMFKMECQSTIISCLQRELPMPQELRDLLQTLARLSKRREPSIEIMTPMCDMLQLRHEIKSGKLQDRDVIMERLAAVDKDFEDITAAFPERCGFRGYWVSEKHSSIFNNTCHIYTSVSYTGLWNCVRSCRILMLETILSEQLERLRSRSEGGSASAGAGNDVRREDYRRTRAKLDAIVHAILASAPQHFGLLAPPEGHHGSLRPIPTGSSGAAAATAEGSDESPGPEPDLTDDEERNSPQSDGFPAGGDGGELPPPHIAPTLLDPTRASDADEDADRFMLLASATHVLVWPLFWAGLSSVCTPAMRAYIVDRLNAVYLDAGLSQAKSIAIIVANHHQHQQLRQQQQQQCQQQQLNHDQGAAAAWPSSESVQATTTSASTTAVGTVAAGPMTGSRYGTAAGGSPDDGFVGRWMSLNREEHERLILPR